MKTRNKGFTLVEIVVTVVILMVLVGVTIGGIYHYVGKSRVNTDIANLSSMTDALSGIEDDDDFVALVDDAGYHNTRWDLIWDATTPDENRLASNIDFKLTSSEDLGYNKNSGLMSVGFINTSLSQSIIDEMHEIINQYASHLFTDGLPDSKSGMTFILSVYTEGNEADGSDIRTRGYLIDLTSSKVYYPDGTEFSEVIYDGNKEYAYNTEPVVDNTENTEPESEPEEPMPVEEENAELNILDEISNLISSLVSDDDIPDTHYSPEEDDKYTEYLKGSGEYFDDNYDMIDLWSKDGTPLIYVWSYDKNEYINQLNEYYDNGTITEEQYNEFLEKINKAKYRIASTGNFVDVDESVLDASAKELIAQIKKYNSTYVGWGDNIHYSYEDNDKYSLNTNGMYLDDNKNKIAVWNSNGDPYISFSSIRGTYVYRLTQLYEKNKITKNQYKKYYTELYSIEYIPTTADTQLVDVETDESAKTVLANIKKYYDLCYNSEVMWTWKADSYGTTTYKDGYAGTKDGEDYYTSDGFKIIYWLGKDYSSYYGSYKEGTPVVNLNENIQALTEQFEELNKDNKLSIGDYIEYSDYLEYWGFEYDIILIND